MTNEKLHKYIYDTISCAHDEPIESDQYHSMRMMIESIEKAFIDAGVMAGEVKVGKDGKAAIHGDATYNEWSTFKVMLLCNVTPYDPNADGT